MYRTLATVNTGGTAVGTSATVQSAVQQLTNLTNSRDDRLRAAKTTLPALVWLLIIGGGLIVLVGVAAVTFIDRPWPQFFALASVAVIFAIVALVIVSLETPFVRNGFFVSSDPMKAALASIASGASV
jgi:membrane protein YdbS with pleckstrin-like domain